MRGELIKESEGQKIVIGNDGQCDSPGFSVLLPATFWKWRLETTVLWD